NTLGALAVGGNEWRRRQFAPLLIDVAHVAPCYEYRDRHEGESPESYGARLARELEDTVDRLGPANVIAFCAETVGGATAGAVPLAVQKVIQRDDLLSSVRRQGDGLRERLQTSFGAHPHIGDIRGRGLLMAIELVDDRASKRPFDPALRLHARIKAEAMAR